MSAGAFAGPGGGSLGLRTATLESFLQALAAQFRVIGLLAYREFKSWFSRSILGGVSKLLEPAIHTLFLYLLYTFLVREVKFGSSVILFLASGFVPFVMFNNISAGASSAMRSARSMRPLAIFTTLDFVLALALVEVVSLCLVYGPVLYLLSFYDVPEAIPFAPDRLLLSLSAIVMLGIGIGLFNSGIGSFFPSWRTIYGRLSRVFMLTCGVHRVAEYVPYEYRKYMLANPMMHAIEWFRSGLYLLYPTNSLDLVYLWSWAAVAFVLGLCLERVIRLRLSHRQKGR